MTTTETTRQTTLRQALRIIRKDFADESYIPGGGPREYQCDQGWLLVRNAPASDGGFLLGVFEAELTGPDSRTIRTYKV